MYSVRSFFYTNMVFVSNPYRCQDNVPCVSLTALWLCQIWATLEMHRQKLAYMSDLVCLVLSFRLPNGRPAHSDEAIPCFHVQLSGLALSARLMASKGTNLRVVWFWSYKRYVLVRYPVSLTSLFHRAHIESSDEAFAFFLYCFINSLSAGFILQPYSYFVLLPNTEQFSGITLYSDYVSNYMRT